MNPEAPFMAEADAVDIGSSTFSELTQSSGADDCFGQALDFEMPAGLVTPVTPLRPLRIGGSPGMVTREFTGVPGPGWGFFDDTPRHDPWGNEAPPPPEAWPNESPRDPLPNAGQPPDPWPEDGAAGEGRRRGREEMREEIPLARRRAAIRKRPELRNPLFEGLRRAALARGPTAGQTPAALTSEVSDWEPAPFEYERDLDLPPPDFDYPRRGFRLDIATSDFEIERAAIDATGGNARGGTLGSGGGVEFDFDDPFLAVEGPSTGRARGWASAQGGDHLDGSTAGVLETLRRCAAERDEATFDEIWGGASVRLRARAFAALMSLRTWHDVGISQQGPFGEITITLPS
jgi:hypothetical protein